MKYTCIFENYICFEPQVCYRGPIQMKRKFGRKNQLGILRKFVELYWRRNRRDRTTTTPHPPNNTLILCTLYRKHLVVYKQKGW